MPSDKPWTERVCDVVHVYPRRAYEHEREARHYLTHRLATDAALHIAQARVEWVVALTAVLSWVKDGAQ